MNRILKIGVNGNSTNYTLCVIELLNGAKNRVFTNIQIQSDYENILMLIENINLKLGMNDTDCIGCGYEVGCRS